MSEQYKLIIQRFLSICDNEDREHVISLMQKAIARTNRKLPATTVTPGRSSVRYVNFRSRLSCFNDPLAPTRRRLTI